MRLVLAFAILTAARPSHALCISIGIAPEVLTTRDTTLPPDGGILVGWTVGRGDDARQANPSDQPDWKATDGAKHAIALKRVSLAPGLTVYQPAAVAGPVILQDKKGDKLGTFKRDPKAATTTLAAPRVKSVKLSVEQTRRSQRTHELAELAAAPPRIAAAVVVYRLDHDTLEALSFVRLADTHDELTSLDAFEDAGRCGTLPAGSRAANVDDRVVFAWVDAFGRLSPVSAPVVVK